MKRKIGTRALGH